MKKFVLFSLSVIFLCVTTHAQTVGLVLSGGGAKGIAHIGIIQALEENNIPIDYITGTSMGAIVGALYAMGFTPAEMMELLKSDDFASWSTGKIDENYIYYFKKPEPTPALATFKIGMKDSSKLTPHFLPKSLINPLPMNYAFMRIFSPHTALAKNDFNNLFVPFRAIASDVYHKKAVIFRNGELGDAVRASMSFPFVFRPIEIDGVLMYDGGIYNNFPVDVMKEDFNPDIIIGSVVTSNPDKPDDGNLMTQIENMIIQKTDYTVNEEDGILLEFDLKDISLLDFPKADQIYKIGYDKTKSIMDSIKSRIPRRVPPENRALKRQIYNSKIPELLFDEVTIKGGNHSQKAYIKQQFTNSETNQVINDEEAKQAYYKLLSDSKISELIPHAVYNEESRKFNLLVDAKMSDNIILGLGAYITSSSSNQIYLGGQYRTLSLYSMDLALNGQFGRTYNAGLLSARFELPSKIPTYLKFIGSYSTKKYYESEKLFYAEESPTFITNTEAYVKLRLGLPFLTNAKTEISAGYGYLKDQYYQSNTVDYTQMTPDRNKYQLLMASLRFEKNTLNTFMYPSLGSNIAVTSQVVFGTEKYLPGTSRNDENIIQKIENEKHSWLQLNSSTSHYLNLNKKFTLGLKSDIVLSSKGFLHNYTSTMIQAPAFTPTPHSKTVFNEAFRSNQFVAAGVVPIWKIINNLHLRTEFYGFIPFFKIEKGENNTPYYGKFMRSVSYMGEIAIVYDFNFASVSIYTNHYSYPKNNWNFGINFGILLYNPKFLE